MTMPDPFTYPEVPHARKHGPAGYSEYSSYRDWLRDEFAFRCVFCLARERWGTVIALWDIDHLVAKSHCSAGILDYDNLLYVCRSCNAAKGNRKAPDPCKVALGQCLRVLSDGSIIPLNRDGEWLIDVLCLNDDRRTRFRRLVSGTVRSLEIHDPAMYKLWMTYPDELPDLGSLRPPFNSRPEGVQNSYHIKRMRGELDEVY